MSLMEDILRSRFQKIGVFCGSQVGCRNVFRDAAVELGEELAKRKIGLVYEGRGYGQMNLISKKVHDAGLHVLGFLPRALEHNVTFGDVNVIADMHERKAAMAEKAEAFIALPGGYETMGELLEMIKWSLFSIHHKMVGIVNVDGYYDGLISLFDTGVKEGFIKSNSRIVVFAPTAKELIEKMEIIGDVTFSLRNSSPSLLSTVMFQFKDICWAIAFIRQLEFCMKLKNRMPAEEHLSVQEFINITAHEDLRHKDGGMWDIDGILEVLKNFGTVLECHRPLTQFVGVNRHTYFEPLRRYKPDDAVVYEKKDDDYCGEKDFHDDICKCLEHEGCVSIRIPMCPSYDNLKYKDIYNPSQEELDYERLHYNGHILLAVGYGYHLNGDLFFECQDSFGVEWGDEGYTRVFAKVVTKYVKMIVYEDME